MEEQFALPVLHLGLAKTEIEAVLSMSEESDDAAPLADAVAVLDQVSSLVCLFISLFACF